MRQLSLVVVSCVLTLVLLASGAWATPSTYSIDGTLADGGTLAGTLTADLDTPLQVNVHGWVNTTYTLLAYDLTLHPAWSLVPDTIEYTDTRAYDLAQLCVGICTFGGASSISLQLGDGMNTLQLNWGPDGSLQPSTFKVALLDQPTPGLTLMGMELVRTGSMTPMAVPEASTLLYLTAGIIFVVVGRIYLTDVRRVW